MWPWGGAAAPDGPVRGSRELSDLQETNRAAPGTPRAEGPGRTARTRQAGHKTASRRARAAGRRAARRTEAGVRSPIRTRDKADGQEDDERSPSARRSAYLRRELHAERHRGRRSPRHSAPAHKHRPAGSGPSPRPHPPCRPASAPITVKSAADASPLRAAIGPTIARPGLAGKRHVPGSAPSCVSRIPAQLGSPVLCRCRAPVPPSWACGCGPLIVAPWLPRLHPRRATPIPGFQGYWDRPLPAPSPRDPAVTSSPH